MKKMFIAAMALATIVSCSKENEESKIAPAGDQTALITVSLKAAGEMTRADVGNYEDGLTEENAINNATFYFFDAAGKAYNVDTDNAVEVAEEVLFDAKDSKDDNIEKTSPVVLVIKQSKNTPPAKIVALLNVANPATYAGMTLNELCTSATQYATTVNQVDYFVMSNSVYKEGANAVYATEILPENIFTTSVPTGEVGSAYPATGETADANAVPVQIYVERVAAKVRVDVSANVNNNGAYPVLDAEGKAIDDTFVKVLGWDVTNAAVKSSLMKKYAETDLFTPVNNPTFFRSYWAETIASANPSHEFTFNALMEANKVGEYDYYHENTLTPTNAEGWYNDVKANEKATKASQLIVATQLVDAKGDAKEFGTWYGQTYTNVADLKSTMINNAAKKVFIKKSDTEYVGITSADVAYLPVDDQTSYYDVADYKGDRRYEVYVAPAENTTYYYPVYAANTTEPTMTAYKDDEIAAELKKIEPAMIWTSGYTYYYTIIDHFGNADGIVRNHIYDIDIKSFNGLGTPVYDPSKVITPEKPVGQDLYNMTAQINILSWALVSQEVDLGN